ncbi:hypothetical protein A2311_00400 [candidate division WOR-1 bacterium RIFOXYB2_FULL_48_7]|uniref:Uncharacterized protein n=1 Tax=candidate division WOR-1 bacterium RIFOXYB2_FULL_48_7 TaxID=1802583 RepID=A0A1F4TF85_UNCSA|nr:MAG: hypothetical protein A2311_00400 [candidate division WOR-1 bacterium RIFOXYB2_FULL_48_7]
MAGADAVTGIGGPRWVVEIVKQAKPEDKPVFIAPADVDQVITRMGQWPDMISPELLANDAFYLGLAEEILQRYPEYYSLGKNTAAARTELAALIKQNLPIAEIITQAEFDSNTAARTGERVGGMFDEQTTALPYCMARKDINTGITEAKVLSIISRYSSAAPTCAGEGEAALRARVEAQDAEIIRLRQELAGQRAAAGVAAGEAEYAQATATLPLTLQEIPFVGGDLYDCRYQVCTTDLEAYLATTCEQPKEEPAKEPPKKRVVAAKEREVVKVKKDPGKPACCEFAAPVQKGMAAKGACDPKKTCD